MRAITRTGLPRCPASGVGSRLALQTLAPSGDWSGHDAETAPGKGGVFDKRAELAAAILDYTLTCE